MDEEKEMKKLTQKKKMEFINAPTNDEVMDHIVWCSECNPAYTHIVTHTMKWRARAWMEDNKIDKRDPIYKWSKEKLKIC